MIPATVKGSSGCDGKARNNGITAREYPRIAARQVFSPGRRIDLW
jgi:hypothetical protein